MQDTGATALHATSLQLVEYELWCNREALAGLARLSAADLHRDFGFGHRTPHRTIFHIADVMQGWSRRVGPVLSDPVWLPYDATLTLADLRQLLVASGDGWLAAARASCEAGVLHEQRRLQQLLHLVTHGTHHRGQLLSMLSLLGQPQPFEGGDFGGWSNPAAAARRAAAVQT